MLKVIFSCTSGIEKVLSYIVWMLCTTQIDTGTINMGQSMTWFFFCILSHKNKDVMSHISSKQDFVLGERNLLTSLTSHSTSKHTRGKTNPVFSTFFNCHTQALETLTLLTSEPVCQGPTSFPKIKHSPSNIRYKKGDMTKCCRFTILEWPVNLTITWQCLIGAMNDTHFCT
jgi:hypothetical protein